MNAAKTDLQRFSGEWETKQVSDFGDVVTGATPSTKVDTFWGEPYPWITPTDISSNRDMFFSERLITQEGLNSIRALHPNTVLVTCIASIGKNAILKTTGGCNQQINAVTPNAAHNAEFLYYLFEFNSNFLLANSAITATNIISKSEFSNLVFEIPPLDEQRAIAKVLSDVDGLINALDALIAKKRAIKQATMQQLLTGKTRLMGFSGEWETKQLGEIASFFKGSSLFTKTDMSLDGKRRCIHYGELFTTYGEYISEVLHGTDREETFFLSVSNDVLMPASDVTPNGLATASCISESDIILGGDILVIRVPTEILNGVFLAYAIKINRNQVMQLVTGTTVYHLYGHDMANFKFDLPSIQEQNAIVRVLSDMDAEITALEQRRDKTLAIKQGMMQQLLTGRVRLLKYD